MSFFYEIGVSFADALKYKLHKLRLKNIPEVLVDVCKGVESTLEHRLNAVEDDMDLKAFRLFCHQINSLIEILWQTNSSSSSTWALPLVKQCYEKLKIDTDNRIILIIHSTNSSRYCVYADILSNFSSIINQPKIVDIFEIPIEAKHDLSSIALIAHEVGHVYLNKNKTDFTNYIRSQIEKSIQNPSLFDQPKIQEQSRIMSSHIEEYICDYIGRILLGYVFDFALLKLFCNSQYNDQSVSSTHPPLSNRINKSIDSLISFQFAPNSDLEKCNKYILSFFKKCSINNNLLVVKSEEIASKYISEILNFETEIDSTFIYDAWSIVKPELDAFRPPFEQVTINEPQLITPTQSLIISNIYYYGKQHTLSNEFYLQSSLNDPEKRNLLRTRLVEHLRYSIQNYTFLKLAKSKFEFSQIKDDLQSTIWTLREIKVSGKPVSHMVIVPTVEPKLQYSASSVDLRLGSTFFVNSLSKFTHITPHKRVDSDEINIEAYYDKYHINIGDEFTIHPHQFVLAQTLEYVCIPSEYYALVLGRSTWGRLGLNIATATLVGSGFRGCITLELRNLGETPIKLTVGTRICQISLTEIPIKDSPTAYFANTSKYIGPTSPEIPKIKEDKDWELLK